MTEKYLVELIEKYANDTATEEEVQRLMDWYHSSSVNDVQWPSASYGEKKEVYERILQRLRVEKEPKKARLLILSWQKVAAALVIIIGTGLLLSRYSKSVTSPYISIVNPSGKIQEVMLPDSSRVWLNAVTELRYSRSFPKSRDVELKGEAYFEVTHDTSHPFTITASGVQTTVLGTSFNIKAYELDYKTTVSVTSGSVQVANKSKSLAVLKPLMQLQFHKQLQKTTTVAFDTSSVLAWKHGKLQFDGESLADIAQSLERWYGIKIIFANPQSKSCRYYMSFDNQTSLEKLLSAIAELTGVKYAIDKTNNVITLSGTACNN